MAHCWEGIPHHPEGLHKLLAPPTEPCTPWNSLLSIASPAVPFHFLFLDLAVLILHTQGVLLYPYFWGWLISFTIMSSRFIHHIEHGRISLFCFVTEHSGKIKYLHTKEWNLMLCSCHIQKHIKILDTGMEIVKLLKENASEKLHTWTWQTQLRYCRKGMGWKHLKPCIWSGIDNKTICGMSTTQQQNNSDNNKNNR